MSQNIVNLLGAGSGIDTQALVSQLVEVERSAPQGRIDNKREQVNTQISDFGLLNSALSTLQDAAAAMGNVATFNTKTAALPDSTDFLPVSLDANAKSGSSAFTISRLAQSQSLSTNALFNDPSDAIGEGVLPLILGAGMWWPPPLIQPLLQKIPPQPQKPSRLTVPTIHSRV